MLKHTAKVKSTATPYLKGREQPTTSGKHIKNLPPNMQLEGQGAFVSANGYTWMNVTSTSPMCWAATQYMDNIVTVDDGVGNPNPDPVEEFPPSLFVRLTELGEQQEYIIVEE